MDDVEQIALKFAAIVLKNALDRARKTKYGVKEYPNGVIAIRTTFLDLKKSAKAFVMETAERYGLARYAVVNITRMRPERAIVIDVAKLNQVLCDNFVGEEKGEATDLGGLVLRAARSHNSETTPTTTTLTTGGDPS